MKSRLELHDILVGIMRSKDLDENVYFQPPENLKLKYPCIIYNLTDEKPIFADNFKYFKCKVYDIMIIDKNPDTEIPDVISELDYCIFSRYYVADNLNHYVYRLYF